MNNANIGGNIYWATSKKNWCSTSLESIKISHKVLFILFDNAHSLLLPGEWIFCRYKAKLNLTPFSFANRWYGSSIFSKYHPRITFDHSHIHSQHQSYHVQLGPIWPNEHVFSRGASLCPQYKCVLNTNTKTGSYFWLKISNRNKTLIDGGFPFQINI